MSPVKSAFALSLLCALPLVANAAAPPSAPPSPPPLAKATPTPSPLPAPSLAPGEVLLPTEKRATPAPPKEVKNNRIGISGVWEVQIQRASGTTYTHFKLAQHGNVLTGTYLDKNGKKYPLAGSIDGTNVRIVVSMPDGSTRTFTGQESNGTDMVGLLRLADDAIGFTASYRPKYKWIDNLNATPGGLGNPGTP